MEVGAGDHRGDDQCDNERKKLKHRDRLHPASEEEWLSVASTTW
jgi:hypothetical protein